MIKPAMLAEVRPSTSNNFPSAKQVNGTFQNNNPGPMNAVNSIRLQPPVTQIKYVPKTLKLKQMIEKLVIQIYLMENMFLKLWQLIMMGFGQETQNHYR